MNRSISLPDTRASCSFFRYGISQMQINNKQACDKWSETLDIVCSVCVCERKREKQRAGWCIPS